MKHIMYPTQGTCSKMIDVTVDDDDVVRQVMFVGGCHGNTQGVARLAEGMKADDVIKKLEGIRCGSKPTSCPDQLCKALRKMRE